MCMFSLMNTYTVGWYEAYEVTSLTSGAEELMRLSVDHMTCHLKQMRNSDTFFEVVCVCVCVCVSVCV